MYSTPYESPAEFQWDADSAPCQSTNCGPTAITKVAVFYKDYPQMTIARTRDLVVHRCGSTNVIQQGQMLSARHVPNRADRISHAKVRDLVKTARRPIDCALLMSRVPVVVRLHPFTGTHSVAVLGLARAKCQFHHVVEDGVWVQDPNFHRDRNTHPNRIFYCDRIFKDAHQSLGGWAVFPVNVKDVSPKPPPPDSSVSTDTRRSYVKHIKVTHNVNVRAHPRSDSAYRGTLQKGTEKTTRMIETHGGKYTGPGGATRQDWVQIVHGGELAWIARAYTDVI